MREKALNLLGLMRRAQAITVGEDNTGSAVRAGKAKLLLTASDASENALKRAEGFSQGRRVISVALPFDKSELSAALSLPGCSMAAVTDIGFSDAFMKLLREIDPEKYTGAADELHKRFEKAQRRKSEAAAHERNKRIGKRRTKA